MSSSLRRSTRSTRGSVKPVVDLTKVDLSDGEDDSKKTKSKDVVDDADSDEVQVLDSEEDEEYQETTTKPKRARKNAKKPIITTTTTSRRRNLPELESKVDLKSHKKDSTTSDDTEQKSAKLAKGSTKSKTNKTDMIDADSHYFYELSEKEMKEVNHAFDLNCMADGGELLDSDNLKTAIRSLGFEPRADEIQQLLKKFANKQGKVNRDIFHKIMAFKMGSTPGINDKILNDEISKVFNLLDLDKTGMITIENLKSIAKELNEEITEDELREMIAEADQDGDHKINKDEFYNIMKKTSLY